jgi:hypothetical protein
MKKTGLVLASTLLLVSLASCGTTTSSSAVSLVSSSAGTSSAATSSVTSTGTSATTSAETSATTSAETSTTSATSATTSATSSTSSESTTSVPATSSSTDLGPLTISAIDGLALPTYSYNAGVYSFLLSDTAKTGATISGTLEGYIDILADTNSTDNQSMELDLNGVTITSSAAAPIYYTSSNSKVIVKANKGTTNTLSYTGTSSKAAVIQSENNIEIAGKGVLTLDGGSKSHGIKCDKLSLTSATSLLINNAGNDGIHAKSFDASAFTGSLHMGTIVSQAFDVNDYDSTTKVASGSLLFPTAGQTNAIQFAVDSCANVFQIDNSFTITDSTSLVVAACTGTYIENNSAADITVTNNGTYTIAGTAQAASIVVAPTTLS